MTQRLAAAASPSQRFAAQRFSLTSPTWRPGAQGLAGLHSRDRQALFDEGGPAMVQYNFSRLQIHPKSALGIQAKLAIGEPNDVYEQEADRIAKRVMRTSAPEAQHPCGCGGACSECQSTLPYSKIGGIQMKPTGAPSVAQASAPPIINEVLQSSGQPLDAQTRAHFEPRFGYDFSRVRIHADAKAGESAQALHALAYTVGPDLVFGAGQYEPRSESGQHLLAHELTHVVQQAQGLQRGIQRQDDEKQKTTPTRDEFVHELLCGSGGAGLFGRTRVSDLFRFSGTFFTDPADVSRPEIEDLRTGKRDLYHVGSWLGAEWEIVKIELNQVTVVGATCGTEEILGREDVALAQASIATPEHSVHVARGFMGGGQVNILQQCKRVEFVPDDRAKPSRAYQFNDAISEYVLEADKSVTANALALAARLGVRLLEYENGQLSGKNCGQPHRTSRQE